MTVAGGGAVHFFRTAQQCPQNRMHSSILQVLSLATAAEEEVEVWEWEGAGLRFFTTFVSVVDHSACHH